MVLKSNPVIFDSNIWIGLFVSADALHHKSKQLFDDYLECEKIVPEYVLLETLTVIKLYTNHKEATACLDYFLSSERLTILPATRIFEQTVTLFQSLEENHLSFIDVSLLALAREYEVKTFDKKLASTIRKMQGKW